MVTERKYLIFGPAYLDITIETDLRLVPGEPPITIDQSLAAASVEKTATGSVVLAGPTGDRLSFQLTPDIADLSSTYHLGELVLARILGPETDRRVVGSYSVTSSRRQIGGMGAGYALAFRGTLRMPLGGNADSPDDTACEVLRQLKSYQISSEPLFLPDASSDSTLLVLSSGGDKLAVGIRDSLVKWKTDDNDHRLAREADALVFCGCPNRIMADIVRRYPEIPVMCAPAMRNVCDIDTPIAELAEHIDYLTMNALEWQHLEGRDHVSRSVPAITITEGPKGSRVFYPGGEHFIEIEPRTGPVNTNRAGETYGSTFFKVLLKDAPDFYKTRMIDADLALRAGQIATKQASRQLDITGFAFPPDDWE